MAATGLTTGPAPSPDPARTRRGARRARSLRGVLGLTALAAALPGGSFWLLHRRVLATCVLLTYAVVVGGAAYALIARREELLRLVVQTQWLTVAVVVLAGCYFAWAGVVVASDLLSRPADLSSGRRMGATAFTLVVCLLLAAPFLVAIRYADAQRTFIDDVFASAAESFSPTRPEVVKPDDPWLGEERVNVLLLGGDAGPSRVGTRTDSIIVASMDVVTGDTVLFSLPRNLEEVPFPEGTELDRLYPNGFTGPGDPLQWMINAIYPLVPELHPAILGRSDNEGADALKLAVSGALGLKVDYYALVSIPGFVQFIDAMGGVTLNVNQPIPIGGITGVREPDDYLEQGPSQHLNGFEALWFARGRYGLDDYDRMRRQRCLVDAVIDRADPITLITRYQRILEAGRDVLRTDIPAEMLPVFVDLAFEVKDAKVRSVVFERSKNFVPESPDYGWIHEVVERATSPKSGGGGGGGGGGGVGSAIDSAESSCTYQPVN